MIVYYFVIYLLIYFFKAYLFIVNINIFFLSGNL